MSAPGASLRVSAGAQSSGGEAQAAVPHPPGFSSHFMQSELLRVTHLDGCCGDE